MKKFFKSKTVILVIKILLTVFLVYLCPIAGLLLFIFLSWGGYWMLIAIMSLFIIPLIIPLIWLKKRKVYLLSYLAFLLSFCILFGVQNGIRLYNESITIDVTPNINVHEYLPFEEDSKIVKLDSKTLKFTEDDTLPIIDGATAAFPVYSAFVNAVYPESTSLFDGVFEYNNTVGGYEMLAEKKTDIFLGAQPSKQQVQYAKDRGTTFKYTQIGSEAFVFFVHKDNPINSLTTEQIKGIYSGKITNWSEVGGADEEIVAFQRNEGSGSQSMLKRFMGNTPIMKPPTEQVNDFIDRAEIDALAVAIGTAHGPYKKKPVLDISRLAEIYKVSSKPLVLHGGSGLSPEQFRATIDNGIRKVNICTEMCVAAREAYIASKNHEIMFSDAKEAVKAVVKGRMQLFGSSNKA